MKQQIEREDLKSEREHGFSAFGKTPFSLSIPDRNTVPLKKGGPQH